MCGLCIIFFLLPVYILPFILIKALHSIFFKKDLSQGLSRNAPYDKIFIEGTIKSIPDSFIKQLKDNGEIFVTLKNQEYVGDFVRALKIESNISIEKFFTTSVKDKVELII